jgi:hypothetical protein
MMDLIPEPKIHISLNGSAFDTRGTTNNLIGDS